MVAMCLFLIVFGLIICFGGIYIRNFCSFVMGSMWGALISTILIVLLADSIWEVDSEKSLFTIFLGSIMFAFFSAAKKRVCAFLNAAMPTFFFVCVFLFFYNFSDEKLETPAIIFFALLVAYVLGCIGWKTCDISHMIQTAFTGAFISSIGFYGLSEEAQSVRDLVFGPIRDDEAIGYIFLGTVILGLIGLRVQWKRFMEVKPTEDEQTTPKNWICECQTENPIEYRFCEKCGRPHDEAEQTSSLTELWQCSFCGTQNERDMIYCSECGKLSVDVNKQSSAKTE